MGWANWSGQRGWAGGSAAKRGHGVCLLPTGLLGPGLIGALWGLHCHGGGRLGERTVPG